MHCAADGSNINVVFCARKLSSARCWTDRRCRGRLSRWLTSPWFESTAACLGQLVSDRPPGSCAELPGRVAQRGAAGMPGKRHAAEASAADDEDRKHEGVCQFSLSRPGQGNKSATGQRACGTRHQNPPIRLFYTTSANSVPMKYLPSRLFVSEHCPRKQPGCLR